MSAQPNELEPAPLLRSVDLNDLATASLPPPRFVVEELLPRREVTLCGGHGDVGKSKFALMIAAHVGAGRDWAGLSVTRGRVLVVSLEDEGDIVKLRLRRIGDLYEIDATTVARNVTVLEAGEDEAFLAIELPQDGTRRLVLTQVYEEIRKLAPGYDLIIIDNASEAYEATENERRMVRRFIRALRRIARENDCAVMLLAHIDKSGARYGTAGNTYSGSTAWHNSVRSRIALVEQDGRLELRHEKHNLSAGLEQSIILKRGEHGVLFPLSAQDRKEAERADARLVLAALRNALAAEIIVPCAVNGPRTAASVLEDRPEIPENLDRARIRAALKKLENEGAIWREPYTGRDRAKRERYQCELESAGNRRQSA